MRNGTIFLAAIALSIASFSASGARAYMTEIDYVDANGLTVGQYVAPCVGPVQMTGVTTPYYTIRQTPCSCENNPIPNGDC